MYNWLNNPKEFSIQPGFGNKVIMDDKWLDISDKIFEWNETQLYQLLEKHDKKEW